MDRKRYKEINKVKYNIFELLWAFEKVKQKGGRKRIKSVFCIVNLEYSIILGTIVYL